MPDPVIIVPYDSAWPAWFERIAAFLAPALAGTGCTVEHVGSTSIPGMAAKPIIDIDIIIDRPAFSQVKERLSAIGYMHQGDQGIPDREAFALTDLQARETLPTHHLYVCMAGAEELRRHLLFRDYLRAHDVDARAYAALKYRLADEFGDDRVGYTEAKTSFIWEIMQKADG